MVQRESEQTPELCGCSEDEENGEFRELVKYTLTGYAGGLVAGFILDRFGLQTSALGQWLVRTLSGESESIFEGIYAIRKRFSRAAGSLAEAYGWGKLLGMIFPWLIDFGSRLIGVNVNGIEGFYIPYFYALSDQIGANVSGFVYLKNTTGSLGETFRAYFKNPVMLSSLVIILAVPMALFLVRSTGFAPSNQVLTALETICANLCWIPPLTGLLKERMDDKTGKTVRETD